MGAVGHMFGLIPMAFWLVLVFAVVAVIFVVRYITNWKFVVPLVVCIFVLCEILVWREHWIDMGYAEAQGKVKEAQTQMEGYRKTEALIENCYASTGYVWDRTQGKCLRADGAQ
jgi:hypothetical protein